MLSLRAAHCWICEKLCGHLARPPGPAGDPPPLRKASHDLANAVMWTYHGREFPAPTFELGMAPAGCMYSTVTDLGRFMSVLFAGGKGPRSGERDRQTREIDAVEPRGPGLAW